MKNSKIHQYSLMAMMAALGTILQFIAFPIPLLPPFLKIDFSDLTILIAMFVTGPFGGIMTAFLRSGIHLVMTGLEPSNLVGDVASFLASVSFTLPVYYFFMRKKQGSVKKDQLAGLFLGTLLMTAFMAVGNYFVITPLYLKFFNVDAKSFLGTSLVTYVTTGIIPFNLLKGALISFVFYLIYKKLALFIRNRQVIKKAS